LVIVNPPTGMHNSPVSGRRGDLIWCGGGWYLWVFIMGLASCCPSRA